MSDPLETIKSQILERVTAKNMRVFYGSTENLMIVSTLWDPSHGDWQEFISIAEYDGVKVLIFEEHVFTQEQLDAALDQTSDPSADVQTPNVAVLKQHVGKLAAIRIGWIKEGVGYFYEQVSSWYDEFDRLFDTLAQQTSVEDQQEIVEQRKQRFRELSERIVRWAQAEGAKRVKKSQLQMYLIEHDEKLGWDDTNTLFAMVNRDLAKAANDN